MLKKIILKLINIFGYDIVRIKKKPKKAKKKQDNPFIILLDFYFFKTASESCFFVQVGANDGKTNDPLYRIIKEHKPSGLLIEPIHAVFEKLQLNYRDHDNLHFANVALAKNSGYKTIYTIKESFQQEYADYTGFNATGLASFDKDHLTKHLLKNMSEYFADKQAIDYLEEITVETLDFNSLVKRYKLSRVDVLQVDCEGYDYEVIKMFDFEKFDPVIINYEHKHLTEEDRAACEMLLKEKGYKLFSHAEDTCAYK